MAFLFSGEIWAMEPKLSLDRVRRLLGGQCRRLDESRRTALCPEAANTEVPAERVGGNSRAGQGAQASGVWGRHLAQQAGNTSTSRTPINTKLRGFLQS